MTNQITERQAYEAYVRACHSVTGEWISEFNFKEWRLMGRPVSQYVKDGYWPAPWKDQR